MTEFTARMYAGFVTEGPASVYSISTGLHLGIGF